MAPPPKFQNPAPSMVLLGSVGLVGRAAEPLLPVELRFVDGPRDPIGSVVLPPVGADLRDLAEGAALDEVDSIAEVSPAALLHAALEDLLA